MGKFKNKLAKFMYGRYGNDKLNNLLLWSYIALFIANAVISVFVELPPIVPVIYLVLSWCIIGFTIFRMFSRNITARRRENDRFFGYFKLIKNKFKDRKTHVYRKCPNCRAVLRLPRAKGRHTVVCPRCKERFSVRG